MELLSITFGEVLVSLKDFLVSIIKPTLALIGMMVFLKANSWIFKRLKPVQAGGNIARNTIAFLIVFLGILIFILSIQFNDESLNGQILTFFGIVISAVIALSSTTLLGNLIAGIMNNSIDRFGIGDLINIGEFQGRVTKKGIFHTEIQLEDSNFTAIPNLYIASNPVKLTRKTKTVISTEVSLGYDVPRARIQECLKEAATAAGLNDPYVFITSLGDYSVVYKIHGFLEDSTKFFSTHSLLNGKVLDVLHENRIEIVSPSFMNQRAIGDKAFIPRYHMEETTSKHDPSPEDLVFDEAIKSEKIEEKKDFVVYIDKQIAEQREKLKGLEDEEEIEKIKSTIKHWEERQARIKKNIEEQAKEKEE